MNCKNILYFVTEGVAFYGTEMGRCMEANVWSVGRRFVSQRHTDVWESKIFRVTVDQCGFIGVLQLG